MVDQFRLSLVDDPKTPPCNRCNESIFPHRCPLPRLFCGSENETSIYKLTDHAACHAISGSAEYDEGPRVGARVYVGPEDRLLICVEVCFLAHVPVFGGLIRYLGYITYETVEIPLLGRCVTWMPGL